MSALHEQAEIPVTDAGTFTQVRNAIETAFSSPRIQDFFTSLQRAGLRIRDFEGIVSAGKLGTQTASEYNRLGNADQGMIRELYLRVLEQVPSDLRAKYFKLYAYY